MCITKCKYTSVHAALYYCTVIENHIRTILGSSACCGIAHNMQQPQNSIIEGYVFMKTKLRFFASGIKKNIVYLNMLPEAKQNPGKHEFKLSLVQMSKSDD